MAKRGKLKQKTEVKTRPIRPKKYKYLFLIVCEDQRTEPDYFNTFISKIPPKTVFLKPVGTGKDPQGVVEQAIIEKNKLAEEVKRDVDEVWAVFDKDDADENSSKIARFDEAFSLANKEKIKIAYSNEAFELWFLLHFRDVDRDTALPRSLIYQYLREQFQKIPQYKDYIYDHKHPDDRTIEIVCKCGNRNSAIKRAESLVRYQKNTKPISANPSTKVHELVKELIGWIDYYS